MIQVRVLFFGPARDWTDIEQIDCAVAARATVSSLRHDLCERFPRLRPAVKHVRFAVNQAFVGDETPLHEGDEVALIPPVSGG